MIIVNNLQVTYSGNIILNQLSTSFMLNQIHGIVGLNGSGKTTFLNTLYGLKQPDQGNISFQNRRLLKSDMAYLVTENFFYSNITGYEYLSLYNNKKFDLAGWNSLFNLPLDTIIDNYSTGMKKKLALMGILKQDKKIIILDEPFNGLDIESVSIVRLILLQLKELQYTIILTSHSIETLTNLCDYIFYLDKGKINSTISREHFPEFQQLLYQNIESKNQSSITNLLTNN